MKLVNAKKKIILAVVLVSAIGVAGLQSANAGPWGGGPHKWGGPSCDGNCGNYGYQRSQQIDDKTRDAFLTETVELRKTLAVKQAEKRAFLLNDNPDPKKVAELTGEIFDLREQLQAKAQDKGIEKPNFGRGPGSCGCDGSGPGPKGFQR